MIRLKEIKEKRLKQLQVCFNPVKRAFSLFPQLAFHTHTELSVRAQDTSSAVTHSTLEPHA
jgi:hypothetical protein